MNNNSYINIRLLDIVSISRESVKEFDGIKKYLSTGDLDFDKIVNLEDITWENKPSRANQLVKENDVLFAKMKDTKKTLIIDDAKKDLIVSTGFYVLTVSEKIMPKYLYYFLSSEIFLRDKNKLCKGATQKALNNEGLSKIKILLPNLNLQYKTIDILDKAKNLIDKRKLQLEYLDELVKSQFIEMFGDPVINPKGWKCDELKNVTLKITDGKHGDCENEENSGYYFISAKDINHRKIYTENSRQITKKDFDETNKRTMLQSGDIVIVNTGATIGKTAIATTEDVSKNLTFQKSVAIVTVASDKLLSEFLEQYIIFDRDRIYNNASGSAQKNWLLSQMRSYKIILPPVELQTKFVNFVREVDKLKFEMEKSLKQLEDNFNSLMQRAFKGELFN